MPRTRDPVRTRRKVLEAGYREFYRHGFQGGSINRIVSAAGITKGALFHHFSGKNELGYAVVDELLLPAVQHWWVVPLQDTEDPIPAIQAIFRKVLTHIEQESPAAGFLSNGCPVCNYAAEMSPLDEGFRQRLAELYSTWRQALSNALKRGQRSGRVRKEVIPDEEAAFLVACFAGTAATGKVGQEPALFRNCFRVVERHLATLLP